MFIRPFATIAAGLTIGLPIVASRSLSAASASITSRLLRMPFGMRPYGNSKK
jgi:hypothetical protein